MKKITEKIYLKWFKDMFFWRKFEDKCRSLYLKQKIRGFLHLYSGQEAIPAGLIHAMDLTKDNMITAYRCHILPIAMGVNPKKIMAELLGKVTGTSKGMGGSMHIFSKKHRFYGGHGIVGGQIPLGAGIAFADKYFHNDSVTVTLMGDGAIRQGSLHETFNMAMMWQLPVIFICENNRYAMGTSLKRSSNIEEIYKIGYAFNMPSKQINGMNPVEIYEEINLAISRARNGLGPSFFEILTYRYRGHSISDAGLYRKKEELDKYKNQDPIIFIKNIILKNGWSNEKEIEKIKKDALKKVEDCVLYAESSENPSKEQMYDLVYHQSKYPFVK